MDVIVNTKTGERGTVEDWVTLFAQVWEDPKPRMERLLALMDDDVVADSQSSLPRSVGRAAMRQRLHRILRGLPDLTGALNGWQQRNSYVFIDMSYCASIGGRVVKWPSIDRVRFRDGFAIERIAYYDTEPLHRAFLRNPKGWSQYARLQAGV
jgi:hypothetical protein